MKTIVHNGEWDIVWYLGRKKKVMVGEKDGKFYLVPEVETVIDLLPFELVQSLYKSGQKGL